MGDGTGNFTLSTTNQPTNSTGAILARDVAIGDFDRDNDPDLAFVNTLPGLGGEASSVTIFVNNKDTSTLNTLSVLINATKKGAIGVGGSDSENGLLRAIEDGSDGGQD